MTGYVEHRAVPVRGTKTTYRCSGCGRVFDVDVGCWAVCPDDPFGEARQRAAHMMAGFAAQHVISEAETAMRGEYPVSVVTGDLCDADDAARVNALGAEAHRLRYRRLIGGSDAVTYVFTGDDAERRAEALYQFAVALGAGDPWWRVTRALYPDRPR